MLIIGRAVAGLGGSGMMNGGLTIIAASAPPEKRPGTYSQPDRLHILTGGNYSFVGVPNGL